MKWKFWFLVSVVLVVIAGTYGVASYQHRDRALSETPPPAATTVTVSERESTATIRVEIPYAKLAAAIDGSFPRQIIESGSYDEKTFPFRTIIGPGPVVVVGHHWSILIERGDVTVSPVSGKLRASIPVKMSGWGGLGGALAALTKLDKKNVRGAVDLFLDVSLDVNGNWEPVVSAEPGFTWSQKAEVEALGGVWVNMSGQVEGKLREALGKAVKDAVASLDPQVIRRAVSPEWRVHRFNLGSFANQEVVTTFIPVGAGFSGLQHQADKTVVDVTLKGRTRTTFGLPTEPAPATPNVVLPPLERIPAAGSDVILDLPVYVPYEVLRSAALAQVSSAGYSGDTPMGKGTLLIRDIKVYPSVENRLAVGIKVSAQFDHRFFDANGWIWLTSKVVVSADEALLRFEDVQFTRALDSQLWSAVTILLDQPIQTLLNHNATVNFSGQVAEGKLLLAKVLADPKNTDKLRITMKGPDLFGVQVALTERLIGISVQVHTKANLEINAIP